MEPPHLLGAIHNGWNMVIYPVISMDYFTNKMVGFLLDVT